MPEDTAVAFRAAAAVNVDVRIGRCYEQSVVAEAINAWFVPAQTNQLAAERRVNRASSAN